MMFVSAHVCTKNKHYNFWPAVYLRFSDGHFHACTEDAKFTWVRTLDFIHHLHYIFNRKKLSPRFINKATATEHTYHIGPNQHTRVSRKRTKGSAEGTAQQAQKRRKQQQYSAPDTRWLIGLRRWRRWRRR